MQNDGMGFFMGFVKGGLRSRRPRLWGWDISREGGIIPFRRSEAVFGCAEDAWKAGQADLATLEAVWPARRASPDGGDRHSCLGHRRSGGVVAAGLAT